MAGIVVTIPGTDHDAFDNIIQKLYDEQTREKVLTEFLIKLPSMVKNYLTTGESSAFGLPATNIYNFNAAACCMSSRLKINVYQYDVYRMTTLKKAIQDQRQITDDEYEQMLKCIIQCVNAY